MSEPQSLNEVHLPSPAPADGFVELEQAAHELCDLWRAATGRPAIAIHPAERDWVAERIRAQSPAARRAKQKHLLDAREYYSELIRDGIPLSDKRRGLQAFLRKFGLIVPQADAVLEVLDQHTYVEIYNEQFRQVFRSLDFLEVTHYGLLALESCEWFELFDRSAAITEQQIALVQGILSGQYQTPLWRPLPPHTVKELRSEHPASSQIEVTLYSPLFDAAGTLQGGLHLFKVQATRSLDLQVI